MKDKWEYIDYTADLKSIIIRCSDTRMTAAERFHAGKLAIAAPDMHAALRMVESCLAPEDNDVTAQKVRAALIKAGM